jgi:hypothetical protein
VRQDGWARTGLRDVSRVDLAIAHVGPACADLGRPRPEAGAGPPAPQAPP